MLRLTPPGNAYCCQYGWRVFYVQNETVICI